MDTSQNVIKNESTASDTVKTKIDDYIAVFPCPRGTSQIIWSEKIEVLLTN